MIVCSCTLITSKDIAEAVASLRTNDPFVVLTPGLIYRPITGHSRNPSLREENEYDGHEG
jgi:hypothetical protein